MSEMPIVVGFSGTQTAALKFAAARARATGVELRVVNCIVRPSWGRPFVLGLLRPEPVQHVVDVAKEVVDRCVPGIEATYIQALGSPGDVLIREAEGSAMLVVGTDSDRWADRLFGESVSARLITSAPVPVAVVPEGCSPNPVAGVVVALDARSASEGALHFAFTEARRRGQELQVLHVFPTGKTFQEIGSARARISEILAGRAKQFPDVAVKSRLVFNEVDAGCLRVGEEVGLLVLSRRPISLATVFFGHPVLERISRGGRCPYVVVPEEWGPPQSDPACIGREQGS